MHPAPLTVYGNITTYGRKLYCEVAIYQKKSMSDHFEALHQWISTHNSDCQMYLIYYINLVRSICLLTIYFVETMDLPSQQFLTLKLKLQW